MAAHLRILVPVLLLWATGSRSSDIDEIPDNNQATCRFGNRNLPLLYFRSETCAMCYHYTLESYFQAGAKWRHTENQTSIFNPRNFSQKFDFMETHWGRLHPIGFADASDPNSPLLDSFISLHWQNNWRLCCEAAVRCCEHLLTFNNTAQEGMCPATWDAWQCWDTTEAGSVALAECPSYIYQEPPSCKRYATKVCHGSGSWFVTSTGKEWSNYTSCQVVDLKRKRTYVHLAAYAISIVALIPALIIFFSYKQLRAHRIIMHKNLFVSILFNCIVVICFQSIVILQDLQVGPHTSITNENGFGCKLLFMLTKYFRITNYMWMFCEGFYLHRLIAAAFAEQKSLVLYYLIGWCFPLVPTIIYAILRAVYADDQCWVMPVEEYEWIVNLPNLLSLVVNMIFLINIIRVLVTKLRAAHAQEPSQYRKAVRATLVLVPLFGLHFIVTIYRPPSGACDWIEIYYYANYLLDGLQGFLVALIFCYLNGEVHFLLQRTYGRFMEQRYPQYRRGPRGSMFLGRSTVSTHCSFMDSPAGRKGSRSHSVPNNHNHGHQPPVSPPPTGLTTMVSVANGSSAAANTAEMAVLEQAKDTNGAGHTTNTITDQL